MTNTQQWACRSGFSLFFFSFYVFVVFFLSHITSNCLIGLFSRMLLELTSCEILKQAVLELGDGWEISYIV